MCPRSQSCKMAVIFYLTYSVLLYYKLFVSFISIMTKCISFSPTGCMFEKGPRQFYDDTCVVPEKFDGRFLTVLQVLLFVVGV